MKNFTRFEILITVETQTQHSQKKVQTKIRRCEVHCTSMIQATKYTFTFSSY